MGHDHKPLNSFRNIRRRERGRDAPFRAKQRAMPTPVEVSHIKHGHENQSGIGGLGGTWRDRPWYMSEPNFIREIERPDNERQSNFFVVIEGKNVPIAIASIDGHKHLTAAGRSVLLLGLPTIEQIPRDE
jgi:hypothetical protein